MKDILMQAVVIVLCLGIAVATLNAKFPGTAVIQKNSTNQDTDAAALFEKHCDTCHGNDGRAKTFKAKFNHARNLTDARWQAEVSDERLFNSINNGKGKMPAWGKKLSEAQINSLVAYVRSLKR